MKICWDMLEGLYLSKEGNLKKGSSIYIEMEACKVCEEPYLTKKHISSLFCSLPCAKIGIGGPMLGKTHTIETRRKLSEFNSIHNKGSSNPNYRGGVYTMGLTMYDIYKDRLGICEDIRKQEGTGILEVRCTYCGRWYPPTCQSVCNRLTAINSLNQGERRLYCSENCKVACPTFGQIKYPRGFKHTTSREVSTYLRQIVLERDNWTCQICGKTIKEIQLHVHHMDPVAQNLMFQNDMDSCITLCKDCHKEVHMQYGCRYIDLRCNKGN